MLSLMRGVFHLHGGSGGMWTSLSLLNMVSHTFFCRISHH